MLPDDAERGGAPRRVPVCVGRRVPGRHAHEVARRPLRRCTSAGRPTRHEVPAGGSTHGLTVRGAVQVRIPRAGDYAARQLATRTRTTSAAAVVTYGRPRANVTVTGGSCSTHVPPIVNVEHPGSVHTESMDPCGRIQSGSDSFCIGV